MAPMWGLAGARLVGTGRESTEVARRHAVWLFPAMFLLHAIFVRALAPNLQLANLIAAAVALVAGLAFRWLQRATAVIAIMFAFGLFSFVYMFGVAAPLTYLVLTGQHRWVPAAVSTNVAVLGSFMFLRVRSSLRHEWAKPLEETPGVQIATADWILWRDVGRETPILNISSIIVGLAFIPAVAWTRNSPQALVVLMLLGPLCLALMLVDTVASHMAFLIAVRRWEAKRGFPLRFPPLPKRRPH